MDMDHGHGGTGDNSSMGGMDMGQKMSYTHMTFFWGKNSEILFSGWPGTRGGMYALALIVVFLLAVLVEWFNHCRVIPARQNHAVAGLIQTAMHAVRVAFAYLVMLAVMSFNGGVLIVAVAGHTLGFFLFGSSVFRRPVPPQPNGLKTDLPPMAC